MRIFGKYSRGIRRLKILDKDLFSLKWSLIVLQMDSVQPATTPSQQDVIPVDVDSGVEATRVKTEPPAESSVSLFATTVLRFERFMLRPQLSSHSE